MSFNHIKDLESQRENYRDDPETRDDPQFNKFSEDLSVKVMTAHVVLIVQADIG